MINGDKYFFRYARCGGLLSVCIGLLFSIVQAEPLSLKQALQRAEAANFGLDALREQQLSAYERIDGASALPNPKLQYIYFGESVETRTGPQQAIYSISQTVPWLAKLDTRKALAVSEAEAWSYVHQRGVLTLRRDVAIVYAEAAYQNQAVQSTESNLRLIDDMRAIVEERVRGGVSLNALLRLEVELERTRDQLDLTRQNHYTQRTQLAALLSIEESALGELVEMPSATDTLPSHRSLLAGLEVNNSELHALKQQAESATRRTDLSRLERYPDFTFGLNYIQVDEGSSMASDAGEDPWNVSVAVSLPIWEGKNRSAIRSAKAERRATEHRYHNRVLQLKAELSAILSRRADNIRRMQRYEQQLIPLAQQALGNSRSAYESDQLGVLELIDSERALLELNLNYARAVANVAQADASVKALTGRIN